MGNKVNHGENDIGSILNSLEIEKHKRKWRITLWAVGALVVLACTMAWFPVYTYVKSEWLVPRWIDELTAEGNAGDEAEKKLVRNGDIAIQPLINVVGDIKADPLKRQRCAEVLGVIKDKRSVDPLIELLRSTETETDTELSRSAVIALGKIKDPKVVGVLGSISSNDENSSVLREAAVESLGNITSDETIPLLIGAFRDSDLCVRAEAAAIIGDIGAKAVEPMIQALLKESENTRFRDAASSALRRMDGRKAEGLLAQNLRENESWQVREISAWFIGRLRLKGLADVLQVVLKGDPVAEVKIAAAEALGWLSSITAVPGLIEALQDDYFAVRIAAIKALGRLRDQRSIGPLIEILTHDSDWKLRVEAALALGRMRQTDSVEPLVRALHDRDYDVREAATQALVRTGGGQVIDLLRDIASNQQTNWEVRYRAIEALAGLKNSATIGTLVSVLENDPIINVRRITAFALGEIGSPEAVQALISALSDNDPYVRRNAASALGKIGDPGAVEPLIGILARGADSSLKAIANNSLQRITGEYLGPDYREWRQWQQNNSGRR